MGGAGQARKKSRRSHGVSPGFLEIAYASRSGARKAEALNFDRVGNVIGKTRRRFGQGCEPRLM